MMTKEKVVSWGTPFYRFINTGLLIFIATILYNSFVWKAEVDQTRFDNVEEKYKTKIYVANDFTPEEKFRIMQHVNLSEEHDFLTNAKFDSIMKVIGWNLEQVRKQVEKNATEIKEIKETLN